MCERLVWETHPQGQVSTSELQAQEIPNVARYRTENLKGRGFGHSLWQKNSCGTHFHKVGGEGAWLTAGTGLASREFAATLQCLVWVCPAASSSVAPASTLGHSCPGRGGCKCSSRGQAQCQSRVNHPQQQVTGPHTECSWEKISSILKNKIKLKRHKFLYHRNFSLFVSSCLPMASYCNMHSFPYTAHHFIIF